MPTLDDVAELALWLPGTGERTSRGSRHWTVAGKGFVWERPLRKTDLRVLADAAPAGVLIGLYTGDQMEKAAMLDENGDVLFDIPHLGGYPAVLCQLDRLDAARLRELVLDAWFARAPLRLADEHRGSLGV